MEKQRRLDFDIIFFRDLIGASLILFLVAFVPFLGAIAFFFIPLPMLYFYMKHGRMKGAAITVFSLLAFGGVLGVIQPSANIALVAVLAIGGIIIGECLKRNYSVEKTVCYPLLTISTFCILFLLFQAFLGNDTPWHLVNSFVDKQIKQSVSFYASLQIAPEQIGFIKDNLPEIVTSITMMSPALFLVGVTLMVWTNLLAGRRLLTKNGLYVAGFGDLSSWKPPEKIVWILIGAGLAILVPNGRTEYIAWNVLVITLSVYLLAGLAIVSFFLKKNSLPSALRCLIYFLIFAQQIITLVVVAAGLFDLWIDFRKLNKRMEDPVI